MSKPTSEEVQAAPPPSEDVPPTVEPTQRRSLRPKPPRPYRVNLVAAVAVVGVAGGAVYTMASRHPEPPTAADRQSATDLRNRAFDACARERWTECLAALDEAKRLDATGDEAPGVQATRRRAEQTVGDKPK